MIAPFRAKYIILDLKKSIVYPAFVTLKSHVKFKKLARGLENDEDFGKFSPEHSKMSKICTLMSCFWPKYKMFELKKYRGVTFDGTDD